MQEITVVTLYVFRQSKDRPNKNQKAGCVENVEMFAPWNFPRSGPWDWILAEFQIKENSNNNEEAEEYYLDEKPNNDNALSGLQAVKASATLNATAWIKVRKMFV